MLLSEREYAHAADILAGHTEKEPLLKELGGWFKDTFGMEVYDYFCGFTNAGRIRLKLVLWDGDSRRKMMKGANPDFRKQERIGRKFSELCRKYQIHEEYCGAADMLVCYDTLQDEIGKRILQRASARIKAVEARDVGRVEILFSSVHVFFETEKQREWHMQDGLCEEIERQISSIVKEYDSLGAFPDGIQCVFTSLQTLNEKYKGSMFYYTR